MSSVVFGFADMELKEVNAGAIEEPNDSDRFISGGESSEETVKRWLGGVLYGELSIVGDGIGREKSGARCFLPWVPVVAAKGFQGCRAKTDILEEIWAARQQQRSMFDGAVNWARR